MPFNLHITSSDGERSFVSLRSPYQEREDAQRTVYMVIADSLMGGPTAEETEFIRRVTAAPLGETVVHGPTGVGFRTEEV